LDLTAASEADESLVVSEQFVLWPFVVMI
jgi:hypothetical protein